MLFKQYVCPEKPRLLQQQETLVRNILSGCLSLCSMKMVLLILQRQERSVRSLTISTTGYREKTEQCFAFMDDFCGETIITVIDLLTNCHCLRSAAFQECLSVHLLGYLRTLDRLKRFTSRKYSNNESSVITPS